MNLEYIDALSLKMALQAGTELALIDPREEGAFGQAHLLLAVNVPLSRIEIRIRQMVPRRTTRIVLCDDGEGMSERAALTLRELGYFHLEILAGGLSAWRLGGFELFSGLSVPGKGFGEWMAVTCGTPEISAEELQGDIAAGKDLIILDSRPTDEYLNMNIPGSINVPVSELVYRFDELSLLPETLVVINCAGRTRSLIGAQTLIDAGVPNRVVALRGGTMAWQVAGFELEHGSRRPAPEPRGKSLEVALARARAVAGRFRVQTIDQRKLATFLAEQEQRSLYIIDVRSPDEFGAGHRPDSFHAWGVQLVQSIDRYVATRNARIVLVDNYQVRALMTAAWLVQAGWPETFVLADPFSGVRLATGSFSGCIPELGLIRLPRIGPAKLQELLEGKQCTVIDFSDSLDFKKGHLPGACFAIRSRLAEDVASLPPACHYVVTGKDVALTALAGRDLAGLSGKPVAILEGGNQAWQEAGLSLATGFDNQAVQPDDVFRMPFLYGHFEDKDEFEDAAGAYFEWELQLPEQLRRAGEITFSRVPR